MPAGRASEIPTRAAALRYCGPARQEGGPGQGCQETSQVLHLSRTSGTPQETGGRQMKWTTTT